MLLQLLRPVVVIVALTAVLSPAAALAQPQGVRLFNGKDLSGWSHFLVDPKVPATDVWSVQDGVLVCKGEPLGYLYTNAEYTSFKLIVEWRWAPGAAARLGKVPNSGVLMRVNGEPKPKGVPRAYEAQLQAGNAGDLYGFWGMPLDGDPGRRREAKGHELLGDMVGFKKTDAAEKPEGRVEHLRDHPGRPVARRAGQREEGQRGEGRHRHARAHRAAVRGRRDPLPARRDLADRQVAWRGRCGAATASRSAAGSRRAGQWRGRRHAWSGHRRRAA